jgi:hypothetical protein
MSSISIASLHLSMFDIIAFKSFNSDFGDRENDWLYTFEIRQTDF